MVIVYPEQVILFVLGMFLATAGIFICYCAVGIWVRDSAHMEGSAGVLFGLLIIGGGMFWMAASFMGHNEGDTAWEIPLSVAAAVIFIAGVMFRPACGFIWRHCYPKIKYEVLALMRRAYLLYKDVYDYCEDIVYERRSAYRCTK